MMMNVLARAASGALRAAKPSLTPQLLKNEAAKVVGSVAATCKYKIYFTDFFPQNSSFPSVRFLQGY